MNKLNKLLVAVLSSLLVSASAFAGDLAVTGSAKASYAINGGDSNNKGLGISNELKFAATGDLDNGFTWSYFMELDGNDGGAHDNDDSQLKIGMGDMGTISINDSEGGLSVETGWGIGAVGTGADYANTDSFVGYAEDVSGNGNIEYATASGMLPFGIMAKVAYVPNNTDGDNNSYKSTGGQNPAGLTGQNNTMYQLKASPLDGLNVGAAYKTADKESGTVVQDYEAGGVYANYSMGNIKVGLGQQYYAVPLAARLSGGAHSYITDQLGVEMAINDAVTISYSKEESNRKTYGAAVNAAAGASPFTRTEITFETEHLMAAYDIGGATVGVTHIDATNSNYAAGDQTLTIVSLAMAF